MTDPARSIRAAAAAVARRRARLKTLRRVALGLSGLAITVMAVTAALTPGEPAARAAEVAVAFLLGATTLALLEVQP